MGVDSRMVVEFGEFDEVHDDGAVKLWPVYGMMMQSPERGMSQPRNIY